MTLPQFPCLRFSYSASIVSHAPDTNDGMKKTCSDFGWKSRKPDERKPRVIDAYAYNDESLIANLRYEELKAFINGTAILTTELNFHGEAKTPVKPPLIPNMHHEVL